MAMKLFVVAFFVLITETHSVCRFSNGQYDLSWVVDRSDNVHFQLTFTNFPPMNAWTGVAFGQAMHTGLDAVVVKVINGQVAVSDEFVQGYGPSNPDRSQDVRLQSAQFVQGVLKVRFSRPVGAREAFFDHPLHGCTTWQFITGPGFVFDQMGHVGKHTRHPQSQIVCLQQCRI